MNKFNEKAIEAFDQKTNILILMKTFNLTKEQWYTHWIEHEMRRHKKAIMEITNSLLQSTKGT